MSRLTFLFQNFVLAVQTFGKLLLRICPPRSFFYAVYFESIYIFLPSLLAMFQVSVNKTNKQ